MVLIEDSFQEGRFLKNFLRIKVIIDVRKALIKGLWIPRSGLPKIWLSSRYEKLHHFCYRCRVLCHDQKVCKKEGKEDELGEWSIGRGLASFLQET